MPHFYYRAKKGPTELVEGTIEAASSDAAVDALSDQGLLPMLVKESKTPAPAAASASGSKSAAPPRARLDIPAAVPKLRLSGRIRLAEITILSRQLASLLRAGVPILRGLSFISAQSDNPRLKKLIKDMEDKVSNGEPLSSVMAGYPKYFPPIMLAMVRTGEDSGTLDTALLRVAEYRQRQEEILARVRTAMAYPVLMALVGAGTIIFMFTFVIPKLSGLFNNLGSKLPLPTRILMSISHAMQNRVAWIIVGALVAGIALYLRARPNDARRLWSRFSLKAPALGDFVLKADMARFARTLELLLKAGIPILRAIEITTPVLSNDILRSEMKKMHEGITAGGTFGQSLAKSREYPLFMTNLVTVGEESGKLDEAMDEIARFYERETDEAIKVLTSLMEPIMILVMGAIVGFIVIAMMLPMFELSLAIK